MSDLTCPIHSKMYDAVKMIFSLHPNFMVSIETFACIQTKVHLSVCTCVYVCVALIDSPYFHSYVPVCVREHVWVGIERESVVMEKVFLLYVCYCVLVFSAPIHIVCMGEGAACVCAKSFYPTQSFTFRKYLILNWNSVRNSMFCKH